MSPQKRPAESARQPKEEEKKKKWESHMFYIGEKERWGDQILPPGTEHRRAEKKRKKEKK